MKIESCDTLKFKKCILFSVISLLAILVCLNFMLTCWLIQALKFSWTGVQDILFVDHGIILNASTWINGNTITSSVKGNQIQVLGNDEVTLKVAGSSVKLDSEGLHLKGDNLILQNMNGTSFLNFTNEGLKAKIQRLSITGSANLLKSLQTEKILSHPDSDIKIESRTNGIKIESAGAFSAYAPAGGAQIKSHGNVGIHAREKVVLNGNEIIFSKLHSVHTTKTEVSNQLCLCNNGKVFAVPPRSTCFLGNRYCYS